MWVAGIGSLAVAVTAGWWSFLPLGLIFLVAWFHMCRMVVRDLRDSPTTVGVIEALGPHPLFRTSATAQASLADGRQVPVVVERAIVNEIMSQGARVEVLFLDDRRSQFALVIAARAIPSDKGPPPPGRLVNGLQD
jgi:hypothetical protein